MLAASSADRRPEPARSGSYDPLTGLPNCAALSSRLDELMAAGEPFCLVLLDADRFKPINDEFGHNEGDRALTLVAEGMRRAAARYGGEVFLCRYAGDEFVMCAGPGDVGEVRERLANVARAKVADAAWEDGRPYRLTVTAGVACWDPSAGMSPGELVAAADRDMYGRKPGRR